MDLHLLQLPPEILFNVLQFTAASSDSAPEQINSLLAVSLTCKALHHLVFCTQNDSIWRHPAITLGIPPTLGLDDVLYTGGNSIQRRRWLNVVKLNLAWTRPFPAGTPKYPRIQKAARTLPPKSTRGDWLVGRRTIELLAAGEGTQRRPIYKAKHSTISDEGGGVFHVSPQGPTVGVRASEEVTGVLDPVSGKARKVAAATRTISGWTATPFPNCAGYAVERRGGEFVVWEVSGGSGGLKRSWNLGEHEPCRFVTNGNILVCVTYGQPAQEEPANGTVGLSVAGGNIPGYLMAFEVKKDVTKVLWEFDITSKWKEDTPSTSFAHMKSFHATATHLVALVTRHPSAFLGKLTRTEFVIMDIRTGNTERTLKFNTKTLSQLSGTGLRAAFTTAFSHDFLLTDTYIVSGGPGGGLLVWNYATSSSPLYVLPDPLGSDATKLDGAAASFPRQYSSLTLSTDGKFVGATTSDQLWIFDMVQKRVQGVYSNGRRIDKRDYYVKNPADTFPGGVWVWWKEWRLNKSLGDGDDEVSWEEVEGGGVAYLTGLLNEGQIYGPGPLQIAGDKLKIIFGERPWDTGLWLQAFFALLLCFVGGNGLPALAAVVLFALLWKRSA